MESLCATACQVAACPISRPMEGCVALCQKLDAVFDQACPQPYQGYLTCIVGNPSVGCSSIGACQSERAAFVPCLDMVCSANPSSCQ
jgi:hypothetical protein